MEVGTWKLGARRRERRAGRRAVGWVVVGSKEVPKGYLAPAHQGALVGGTVTCTLLDTRLASLLPKTTTEPSQTI